MAKRKRDTTTDSLGTTSHNDASKVVKTNRHVDVKTAVPTVQIVAGSYERVLHGITASISNLSSSETSPSVQFADTFLFNAHAGSVRCLALSPLPDENSSETQGIYLATGGSDEKVNVFSLAASPVSENGKLPPMPSLGKHAISENPRNRELGTLLHHSSHITALHFPTRSKLLSGSEDNTIAVTRLKDLTVISTIRAPRPKVQGQPSGDTAPPGATPAGINDFSVHPSLKLMLSVGRGERCMRLWNLVTGKKAGVLNFNRDILQGVREGKYSSGEGRRIRWSSDGSEFAVAFERGVVVFGEDSKPRCKILPQPLTKLHQMSYVSMSTKEKEETALLAMSTEDGRILFYNPDKISRTATEATNGEDSSIPNAMLVATVGGKAAAINTRVKDFEILFVRPRVSAEETIAIITASSNGTIRIIQIPTFALSNALGSKTEEGQQLGEVIGTYETGQRITCLKAFVMLPPKKLAEDEDFGDFGSEDGVERENGSDSDEE